MFRMLCVDSVLHAQHLLDMLAERLRYVLVTAEPTKPFRALATLQVTGTGAFAFDLTRSGDFHAAGNRFVCLHLRHKRYPVYIDSLSKR